MLGSDATSLAALQGVGALVDGDDSGPRLVAAAPTEVWRLLSGLLLADDDLSLG